MPRREKAVYLTGKAANVMLDIYAASQNVPTGVPVPVTDADCATELERAGLIERHHLGAGSGAVVTKRGAAFIRDATRYLSN